MSKIINEMDVKWRQLRWKQCSLWCLMAISIATVLKVAVSTKAIKAAITIRCGKKTNAWENE